MKRSNKSESDYSSIFLPKHLFILEWLYVKLRLCDKYASPALASAAGAVVISFLSVTADPLKQIIALNSFLDWIWKIALVLVLTFKLVPLGLKNQVKKLRESKVFANMMAKYTIKPLMETDTPDKHSQGTNLVNFYSWGYDRTLCVCPNLLMGWTYRQIKIESYDDVAHRYDCKVDLEEKLSKTHHKYHQQKFKTDRQKINDMDRWMVTTNFESINKSNPGLYLHLQRTKWNKTKHLWDYYSTTMSPEDKKEVLTDLHYPNTRRLPNSFCLHLLVETEKGHLLLAQTSRSKSNDYPATWAATIGEQIESSDFMDGNLLREDFIREWVRRSVVEEFGIEQESYETLVDESSIRILALTFEGDIYNISLVTVVRFSVSLQDLQDYMASTPVVAREICNFKEIEHEEIPKILLTFNPENPSKEYHPSTYLRLLLYYIHKKGYAPLVKKYLDENRKDGIFKGLRLRLFPKKDATR